MLGEQNVLFEASGVQTVSLREFARTVGKTEAWVRKLIRAGKLTAVSTTSSGAPVLLLDAALAEWRALYPETASEPGEEAPANLSEMQQITIRTARLREQRLQFEIDRDQGVYLHISDVRATFGPMLERSVEKLEGLEDRLLPLLPGNPVENARIIRAVIQELRDELQYVDPTPRRRRRAATTDN